MVETCLTLPNLGFLWVFFKYLKISKNGNPLFFPVLASSCSLDFVSVERSTYKYLYSDASLLLNNVGILKPFVFIIEEEAMPLSAFYYCFCTFLATVTTSTHVSVICHHSSRLKSLFHGHVSSQNFT